MKKRNLNCLGLALFLIGWIAPITGTPENFSKEGEVVLLASKNLSKTVENFVTKYPQESKTIEVRTVDQTTENLTEALSGSAGGFFEESTVMQTNSPSWKLIIGREIKVAVVNIHNPFIETLKKEGLSATKIKALVSGEADWGSALGHSKSMFANVFRNIEENLPESADNFWGIQTEAQSKALALPEFILSIQSNPNSIGFCRLSDILTSDHRSLIEGIVLLPLDKNNNGQLDYHEQIYGTVENFLRGVWIGKYPNQLVSNIYFVSSSQPQNQALKDFLSWIVTDGQQYLASVGVNELTANERLSKLEKINPALNLTNENDVNYAGGKPFLAFAGLLVIAGIIAFIFTYRHNRLARSLPGKLRHNKVFNEAGLSMPTGLYFDKTHTWIFLEKDGLAKVGIDDFLQFVTGNYTKVKMKEPGSKIKKGEPILSLIQNGKQINLNSPVSGTIREINELLVTHPETVNYSPYDEGWVYQIEPSNWLREIQFFNLATAYKGWVKTEFIRLKDFLATFINNRELTNPMVSLQEGGELKSNVLHDLGPELWEEFQTNFLDSQKI